MRVYSWGGWGNCAWIEIKLRKTHFEIVKECYNAVLSFSIYKPPHEYRSINHIVLQFYKLTIPSRLLLSLYLLLFNN